MWKPAEFTSEQRMTMAREITELLMARYGERLVGVLLEGSVAKGTDRPVSDLELSVVLTDGGDRWYPFFRRGMFVGISYKSLEGATSSAGSIGPSWPVAGDALQTGIALYDPTGLYPKLLKKHLAAVTNAAYKILVKDVMADMYENVLKIFSLHPSEGYQAGIFAGGAAYLAALAVGLANKHRYLSVRRMFEESFALSSLPEGYREGILGLLSAGSDVLALRQTLGQLWPALVSWAASIGATLDDDAAEI